jgi:hypothetical protein
MNCRGGDDAPVKSFFGSGRTLRAESYLQRSSPVPIDFDRMRMSVSQVDTRVNAPSVYLRLVKRLPASSSVRHRRTAPFAPRSVTHSRRRCRPAPVENFAISRKESCFPAGNFWLTIALIIIPVSMALGRARATTAQSPPRGEDRAHILLLWPCRPSKTSTVYPQGLQCDVVLCKYCS